MRRLAEFFGHRRDAVLFAALLGLGGLMLSRYLGAERTFYYWDHALYPQWAFAMFMAVKTDAAAAWAQFVASLNDDYSRIYTVPEIAVFALFGPSRLTYMLANFIVYGGGLALAIGAIAARLTGWGFWRAAWLALAALLALPFVWGTLADAYPDMGGTVVLAGALALVLRRWPEVNGRVWVMVGALLALAILFRRHFIYPAAALLTAAGMVQFFWRAGLYDACVRAVAMRRFSLPAFTGNMRQVLPGTAAGVAGAVAVCAGLLYLAAPEFVERLLRLDYGQLYASYAEDQSGLLDRQLLVVGPLTLCVAGAGYALAWRTRAEIRARLALLLLLGLLWGALWFGVVRFGGKHYLVQILPILISVGWLLLGRELWDAGRPRRLLAGVLGFVLAAQALLCFWFGDLLLSGSVLRQPLLGIFATARPPLARPDAAKLRELVDYLHATGGGNSRIAVVASSHQFNQDLLGSVDQARMEDGGVAGVRLPIVAMPEVDRRDALPLDAIAQANILVVATPPQYHLRPEGQLVIGSVLELLAAPGPFAEAWRKDDREFMLDRGVLVTILRRKQVWTPQAQAAMLGALRDRAALSGSMPQDWVVTRADFNGRLATDGMNRTTMLGAVIPQRGVKPWAAFFMIPLAAHDYHLSGKISAPPECRMVQEYQLRDGAGKLLRQWPVTPQADGTFSIDLPAAAVTGYLQLEVTAEETKLPRCPFAIEHLQVVSKS